MGVGQEVMHMGTKIRTGAAIAFVWFMVAACTNSTDSGSGSGGGMGGGDAGEANGGYSAGSSLNIAICVGKSLPAGGCSGDVTECKMTIAEECDGGTIGAVNYWQCGCEDGMWQCAHTGGNSSICSSG